MTQQTTAQVLPPEMKVLMNHIYEYKKGVRRMILFTCNRRFEAFATQRLCRQSIDYVVQPAGKENINVYFGRRECLDAIRLFVTRPLNELSPEEDFILGAMLGYDICAQCERYCERKAACKRKLCIKNPLFCPLYNFICKHPNKPCESDFAGLF